MSYTDIKLSMEAIEEFRQIWKQEFGEEISCEQAEMRGKELVHLFEIIYRPVTSHHPDTCHKERKICRTRQNWQRRKNRTKNQKALRKN